MDETSTQTTDRSEKMRELRGTLFTAAQQAAELLVPSPQARKHFRQARVEILMGVRELVDQRISHLKRDENKGTRVTVE
jgi:hypothetical protein